MSRGYNESFFCVAPELRDDKNGSKERKDPEEMRSKGWSRIKASRLDQVVISL